MAMAPATESTTGVGNAGLYAVPYHKLRSASIVEIGHALRPAVPVQAAVLPVVAAVGCRARAGRGRCARHPRSTTAGRQSSKALLQTIDERPSICAARDRDR